MPKLCLSVGWLKSEEKLCYKKKKKNLSIIFFRLFYISSFSYYIIIFILEKYGFIVINKVFDHFMIAISHESIKLKNMKIKNWKFSMNI